MVDAMLHEPTYVTGTLSEPSLGIHVGWAAHAGSFSDCMPAWNETRDVCLVFAGEDFTDRDDIARLRARGHDCEAGSAHYLVHLYEESGLRFLRALNGWFSGVLIDLRESRAVLFNDRFGLHRLHYHERPDGLYFASEAKSLLRVLPELRRIDHAALAELFRCGCVLQGKTLFPGIEQVPGGAMWTVTPQGGVAKGQYFESQEWERQPPMSDAEFRESFGATFARVLPRYFRGTGDVAMSLTGGLDGRMIMAYARPSPGALPCYTFAGEYRDCADVTIARVVAAMCGQPHQTLSVGRAFCDEFGTLAERSVYFSDGAMDVTGSVELYANRLARRISPIRLTGNYGSEIVRGNIAFGPGNVAKGFLSEEFLPHFRAAEHAFDSARDCTDLSFVAFRQVPWYHYARFSVEQSQLTPRSPISTTTSSP